ncbi:MAG TPA: hypothetical protein VG737_17910, partial [Cyclobacteriaceae bacterium]|nr:hypothetical protein [Cyclobacteriaceae bacterium]
MTPLKTLIPALLSVNLISMTADGQQVQYDNGQWFEGTTFRKNIWYSVNGVLTSLKPASIDTIV